MTSKIRQPIFSFDMDMDMDIDVDETPKKMKSGKIIDRKTKQQQKKQQQQQQMWKLYCVLYCDDMLLQLARCDTADYFKCAFKNAPLFSNSHS